jgi:hypothetical protein
MVSFKLWELTPEVLGHITDFILAVDVVHLLMCGWKALNSKLAQGGVRTFRCQLDYFRPACWPSMVRELQYLRNFSLENPGENSFRSIRSFNYDHLPRTLQVLKIGILGSHFETFYTPLFNISGIKSQPQAYSCPFPCLEVLELASLPDLWEMALPSSLTRFAAGRRRNRVDTNISFCNLPRNLVELELLGVRTASFQAAENVLSGLYDLPPGLTTLVYDTEERVGEKNMKLMRSLPPGLVKLYLDFETTHQDISEYPLPRGLTDLYIPFMAWPNAALKALPAKLTKLVAPTILQCDQLGLLPPNLRHLNGFVPRLITPGEMSLLPRSLTLLPSIIFTEPHLIEAPPGLIDMKLSLSGSKLPNMFVSKFVQLRKLQIHSIGSFDAEGLPKSLEVLRTAVCEISLSSLSKLPPSIVKLVMRDSRPPSSIKEPFGCEHFKHLPPKLTKLVVSFSSGQTLWKLKPGSSSAIPRTLTCLKIQLVELPQDWLTGLPTGMLKLVLACKQMPYIPGHALPQLQSLTIISSSRNYRPTLSQANTLPRRLTSLTIRAGAPNTSITNEEISKLPGSLTSLILPSSPKVNQLVLNDISPNLVHFILGYRTPSWFRPEVL